MSWTIIAILSAAVYGVVNILDSYLLFRRMPSFRSFLLPVAVFHFIFALVLFFLFPLRGVTTQVLLIAIASGILITVSVAIMLYSLKKEEVSRVIPVVQTYPIFVAIMAIPLLGERLGYLDWIAIFVVVAGAIMLSYNKSSGKIFSVTLLLLFFSSLLSALANITGKYALNSMSFWNLYYISDFCFSGIFFIIAARRSTIGEIKNMKQRNSALGIIILDEILAIVAIILSYVAIQRGPVALASTILSTRPIFVVVFAFLLSRIVPNMLQWQAGKKMLAFRIFATLMIIAGIAIIELT